MPPPTPPTGMNQAEVDAILAQLTVQGEQVKQDYIRRNLPPYLQASLAYAQANPSTTAAVKTATGAVVASPATLVLVTCNTPGTGTLNINDATTLGGSNASNQIFSKPAAEMTAGQSILLNTVCAAGITISSMPASGNYTIVTTPTPPSA